MTKTVHKNCYCLKVYYKITFNFTREIPRKMLVVLRIPSILKEKSTEKCWSVSKIWGKYNRKSITFSGWSVGRSVGRSITFFRPHFGPVECRAQLREKHLRSARNNYSIHQQLKKNMNKDLKLLTIIKSHPKKKVKKFDTLEDEQKINTI